MSQQSYGIEFGFENWEAGKQRSYGIGKDFRCVCDIIVKSKIERIHHKHNNQSDQ